MAKQVAVPGTTELRGASCVLEGRIPVARVHELEQRLPGLTRGEGELECAFDHNPLDRKEYLLNVTRRVGA